MGRIKEFLLHLWTFRKSLIVFLSPLVFLPIPLVYTSEAGRCAYAIMIMGAYWVTEAIPMAATALLPVVLMPWLGVLGSKQICMNYLKDGNMLFVGGLMVAVAVEKWNLHRRIALRVLLVVGSRPKWLMFGFMTTTAFLSMWISNTATTAMMIPIVEAVLISLEGRGGILDRKKSLRHSICLQRRSSARNPDKQEIEELARLYDDALEGAGSIESLGSGKSHATFGSSGDERVGETTVDIAPGRVKLRVPEPKPAPRRDAEDERLTNIAKGLCLCVAYSANIGGTATLTGTPPNIVLKGQINTLYGRDAGVSFVSWFIIAFPNMLISLFIAWIWLQLVYLGPRELFSFCKYLRRRDPEDDINDGARGAATSVIINQEYAKLGPMSFAEGAVLIHFIVLVLLWITREPEFVPGYSEFLKPGFVTDACIAMTVGISLFICPSTRPNFLCCRKMGGSTTKGPVPALLDWETVHQKMAWSVVILLGGGFALADACKASQLSAAIGNAFEGFRNFPVWLLVLVLCAVTAAFTEFTSNVATCTIFIPILAELAKTLDVNPLYLIIPVTISSSFAFMLPVATPPNAIVFAYGRLRIIDMVKTGIVMNIVCILVLQLAVNTWGKAYFDFGTNPDWAKDAAALTSTVSLNTTVPSV